MSFLRRYARALYILLFLLSTQARAQDLMAGAKWNCNQTISQIKGNTLSLEELSTEDRKQIAMCLIAEAMKSDQVGDSSIPDKQLDNLLFYDHNKNSFKFLSHIFETAAFGSNSHLLGAAFKGVIESLKSDTKVEKTIRDCADGGEAKLPDENLVVEYMIQARNIDSPLTMRRTAAACGLHYLYTKFSDKISPKNLNKEQDLFTYLKQRPSDLKDLIDSLKTADGNGKVATVLTSLLKESIAMDALKDCKNCSLPAMRQIGIGMDNDPSGVGGYQFACIRGQPLGTTGETIDALMLALKSSTTYLDPEEPNNNLFIRSKEKDLVGKEALIGETYRAAIEDAYLQLALLNKRYVPDAKLPDLVCKSCSANQIKSINERVSNFIKVNKDKPIATFRPLEAVTSKLCESLKDSDYPFDDGVRVKEANEKILSFSKVTPPPSSELGTQQLATIAAYNEIFGPINAERRGILSQSAQNNEDGPIFLTEKVTQLTEKIPGNVRLKCTSDSASEDKTLIKYGINEWRKNIEDHISSINAKVVPLDASSVDSKLRSDALFKELSFLISHSPRAVGKGLQSYVGLAGWVCEGLSDNKRKEDLEDAEKTLVNVGIIVAATAATVYGGGSALSYAGLLGIGVAGGAAHYSFANDASEISKFYKDAAMVYGGDPYFLNLSEESYKEYKANIQALAGDALLTSGSVKNLVKLAIKNKYSIQVINKVLAKLSSLASADRQLPGKVFPKLMEALGEVPYEKEAKVAKMVKQAYDSGELPSGDFLEVLQKHGTKVKIKIAQLPGKEFDAIILEGDEIGKTGLGKMGAALNKNSGSRMIYCKDCNDALNARAFFAHKESVKITDVNGAELPPTDLINVSKNAAITGKITSDELHELVHWRVKQDIQNYRYNHLAATYTQFRPGEIRLPPVELYNDYLSGEEAVAHTYGIKALMQKSNDSVAELFNANKNVPVYEIFAGTEPIAGFTAGLEKAQARAILAPFSKELRTKLGVLEGIGNRIENANNAALDFIQKGEFKPDNLVISRIDETNGITINIKEINLSVYVPVSDTQLVNDLKSLSNPGFGVLAKGPLNRKVVMDKLIKDYLTPYLTNGITAVKNQRDIIAKGFEFVENINQSPLQKFTQEDYSKVERLFGDLRSSLKL